MSSPAFHTLAKDMSLTEGETHFTLFMYYLILPIINIPPPPVAPLVVGRLRARILFNVTINHKIYNYKRNHYVE